MLKILSSKLQQIGIDPKFFDFVSQVAHFSVWYGIVKTLGDIGAKFHHRLVFLLVAMALCLAYSIWHEFFWDPTHEDAETRGSDLRDFAFLVLGGSIGFLASWLLR